KPANVLISEDGDVKVTDFGIARVYEPSASVSLGASLHSWSDEAPPFPAADDKLTEDGQIVGTPAYMPPEQFLGRPLTAAADQYAFCASLWEGITGRRPFDRKDPPLRFAELLPLKASGPPRWPASASAVPRAVQDVIARGLAADPGERWATMAALLNALSRDPKRRRRRLIAASVLPVAVASGFGWQAYEHTTATAACREEGTAVREVWNPQRADAIAEAFTATSVPHAARAWQATRPRLDAFADAWEQARTDACTRTEVDASRAAPLLARSRSCLDEQLALVRALIQTWSEPDTDVVDRATDAAWRLPAVTECNDDVALSRRTWTDHDPQTAQALLEQTAEATALRQAGRCTEALARVQPLLGDTAAAQFPRIMAAAKATLGRVELCLGRYEDAEHSLRDAYYEAEVAGDDLQALRTANTLIITVGYRLGRHADGEHWAWLAQMGHDRLDLDPDDLEVANTYANLGVILTLKGDYERALAAHGHALETRRSVLGPDHPDVASVFDDIGRAHRGRAAFPEALAAHRQALAIREASLGPEHLLVAATSSNIGNIYQSRLELDEALDHHRRALAIREARLPEDHLDTAISTSVIGTIQHAKGDRAAALDSQQRALAMLERSLGPADIRIADVLDNMGLVLLDLGRLNQALAAHTRALSIRERDLGPDHPDVAAALSNAGVVLGALKRYDESMAMHRRSLRIREQHFGADNLHLASSHNDIGVVQHAQGDDAQALASHERAMVILESALPEDHPRIGATAFAIGTALLELGRSAEAVAALQRALRIHDSTPHPGRDGPATRAALAVALWDGGGDRTRAVALAERALQQLRHAETTEPDAIARVQAWLASHRLPPAPGTIRVE
nr:tetratricopeptide repeat protein [Deltaproteobacteria bacterium]